MKNNIASPLFIAFLILSAQIVEAQLIQTVNVNVNLGHPQESSNSYLNDYHKIKLKNKNLLPQISNIGVQNTKNKEFSSNQSQNNHQVELGSGRSRFSTVIVNVNVNRKGYIDIETSKTQPKEQNSKKISLRIFPQSEQTKKENVSQALSVQKVTKLDKPQGKRQQKKKQQQKQKEVVSANKETKVAEVIKQSVQEVKVDKVEKQTKDMHKPEQQKEHKYISKIYVETPKTKQTNQKQLEVVKQSNSKKQYTRHEQKQQEQKKIAVQTSQKIISQQVPKVMDTTTSPTQIHQTKAIQTLTSETKKDQIPKQITNISKQPSATLNQPISISQQIKQVQTHKQSVVKSNPIQSKAKSEKVQTATPLAQKSKQTVINSNIIQTKPEVQTTKSSSETTHPIPSENDKHHTVAEQKSVAVNLVPVEDLKPKQPQQIVPATTGGIVDKPVPPIQTAPKKPTLIIPTQEKFIPTPQNKQEQSVPTVKPTDHSNIVDLTPSPIMTSVANKETENVMPEPVVTLPKVQQKIAPSVNETIVKQQQHNIITTPISIIQGTKADKPAQPQDKKIVHQPVLNSTQIKQNSLNQPVEYLSISECNPGCDINSQTPICYQQSCRGCFTDQECSSIMKDGSILGNSIEGVCHLETGKCIAKQYLIQQ